MKKLCAFLLCLLLLPVSSYAANVSAAACVLYDPLTGAFLYEKDADTPRPIASTTKLMTALAVLSCAELDEVVTIPVEATRVEGSRIYVKAGDELTLETLLYGLMLASGNDAALALALHCDGSVDAFAQRMNDLAADMGLNATHFVNPHGLPSEGHVSTARELALMMAAARESEPLRTIMGTREMTREGYHLVNHNKLLRLLDGADGGKTGFTKSAGRCLASSVTREGRTFICVTLNAPDDWNDHIQLYEEAFAGLERRTIACKGETLATVPVAGGHGAYVPVSAVEDLSFPVRPSETVNLRLQLPHHVYAPVCAGGNAGTAQLLLDGRVVAQTPLQYAADVELPFRKLGFWQRILRLFQTVSVPFAFSTSTNICASSPVTASQ